MKKNLSSKAIKSMAIGLSIAIGAGTGISSVGLKMAQASLRTVDTTVSGTTAEVKTDNTIAIKAGTDKQFQLTNGKFESNDEKDTKNAFTVEVTRDGKPVTGYSVSEIIISDDGSINPSTTQKNGNSVVLKLNKKLAKNDKVKITYIGTSATNKLQYGTTDNFTDVKGIIAEATTSNTIGLEKEDLANSTIAITDNAGKTNITVTLQNALGANVNEKKGIVLTKKGGTSGQDEDISAKIDAANYIDKGVLNGTDVIKQIVIECTEKLDNGNYTVEFDPNKDTSGSGGFTSTPKLTRLLTGKKDFTKPIPVSATVGDVDVIGETDKPITNKDVTITVTNDTFSAVAKDTDVSSWFTNLPTGLTAKIKTAITGTSNTATITITGTPTETKSEAMSIKIPANSLTGNTEITVTPNENAKFNITLQKQAPKPTKIEFKKGNTSPNSTVVLTFGEALYKKEAGQNPATLLTDGADVRTLIAFYGGNGQQANFTIKDARYSTTDNTITVTFDGLKDNVYQEIIFDKSATGSAALSNSEGKLVKFEENSTVIVNTLIPNNQTPSFKDIPNVAYNNNIGKFTLDMNERLVDNKSVADHGFTITNNNKNVKITSVEVKGSQIIITTDKLENGGCTVEIDNQKLSNYKAADDDAPATNITVKPCNIAIYSVGRSDTGMFNFNGNALLGYAKDITKSANDITIGVSTLTNGMLNGTTPITEIGDGKNATTGFTDQTLSEFDKLGQNKMARKISQGNLSNIKTVKANAFKGNTKITKIELPNVTKMEDNVFYGATNLTTIILNKNNKIETTPTTFKGVGGGKSVMLSGQITGTVPNNVQTDNIAPSITGINYNSVNKKITITTDEKLDETKTINKTKIKINGEDLTNINANINTNGKNIEITLNKSLSEDTHTVIIEKGSNITDKMGNEIVKYTGSFTYGNSDGGRPSGSYSSGSVAILNNSNKKNEGTTGLENENHTETTKNLTINSINLPSLDGEIKEFDDILPLFWANEHIQKLSSAGIINGTENGKFEPNGNTKRADVTIMITKLLGITNSDTFSFTDVEPDAYYAPYVATAKEYGIVSGSNGLFRPNEQISRQDTMVMIGQILKSLALDVDTDESILANFGDSENISEYAKKYVSILVNSGIITGDNYGNINPKKAVTRAEMATIMSKLYDKIDKIETEK